MNVWRLGTLVALVAGLPASGSSADLFRASDETTINPSPGDGEKAGPAILRSRQAGVCGSLLSEAEVGRRTRIDLNLFDDARLTGVCRRVERTSSRRSIISGPVADGRDGDLGLATSEEVIDGGKDAHPPMGHFVLVRDGGLLFGVVHSPDGRVFEVDAVADDVSVIREIDRDRAAKDGCGAGELKAPAPEKLDLDNGLCPTSITKLGGYSGDDDSTLDVMVYYTATARNAAGGVAAIESRIDIATATTNLAMSNSLIPVQVRIVRKALIDYTETGLWENDLPRLTEPADGFLDQVHAERDTYGADIVFMWVENLNTGGVAYSLATLGPEDHGRAGFGVMRQDNYPFETFAHELGHSFGCQHDRATNNTGGFFDYSYGYRQPCIQPCTPWKTIMAYPPGDTILYYSSPDIEYNGEPVGGLDEFGLPCNNRLTILNTAWTLANFRPSVPTSPPPSRLYVNAAAAAGGIGSTWGTAMNDLQEAIGVAAGSQGVVQEIWVAAGTYKPDRGRNDRLMSFRLVNDVSIYGGFGGAETSLAQRDPVVNVTILSGDIGTPDDTSDNSYHVLNGDNLDATAVLDGFNITGGNADGTFYPHDRGAGMRNVCGSATLIRCAFTNNTATNGAGMDNLESYATLVDCTFAANTASFFGGGMRNDNSSPNLQGCTFSLNSAGLSGGMGNENGSTPTLTDCRFEDNSADWGGGMSNYGSSPTLTGCVFFSNDAVFGGGGMENGLGSSPALDACNFEDNAADFGGGMYNYDLSNPTLSDCIFTGNSADGAGMYNDNASPLLFDCSFLLNTVGSEGAGIGAGMYNVVGSAPYLVRCDFAGNSAGFAAGGLIDSNSASVLFDCAFTENSAWYAAGVWSADASNTTLFNCGFFGNTATYGGGGIHVSEASIPLLVGCVFSGNDAPIGDGGAVWNLTGGNPTLLNCTLSRNSCAYNGGGVSSHDSVATLTNCILWGNADWMGTIEDSQVYSYTSPAIVNHSIVQGLTGALGGTGNLGGNPLFVDADGMDNTVGTPDDDLNLGAGSPAIDAGDTTALPDDGYDIDTDGDTFELFPLDYDGNPRVLGAKVDKGAQEAIPLIPGDFNGDGFVAADDHSLFDLCSSGPTVQHDGTITCQAADLDDDNDVDVRDHGIFQGCYSGYMTPGDPECAD